jgi:hypothetical protein
MPDLYAGEWDAGPDDDEQEENGRELHIQFCGDEWYSADGPEAAEIRLWDGDDAIAVVIYNDHGQPSTRGTYTIEHAAGDLKTEAEAAGWRDWHAAIIHAATNSGHYTTEEVTNAF